MGELAVRAAVDSRRCVSEHCGHRAEEHGSEHPAPGNPCQATTQLITGSRPCACTGYQRAEETRRG